jgi:quercetin dioxygenase-like cupin family protein
MIIKEVLAQLAQSQEGPVIKVLENGEQFKVIVMAFKKDMVLKAHQTSVPARLVVIEGRVNYLESERSVILSKFEDLCIPVNVQHSVKALEDAVCLLIKG